MISDFSSVSALIFRSAGMAGLLLLTTWGLLMVGIGLDVGVTLASS